MPCGTPHVYSFADDTTLYYSSHALATAVRNITTDLEKLTEWFKSNKLSLTDPMLFHSFILISIMNQSYGGAPHKRNIFID